MQIHKTILVRIKELFAYSIGCTEKSGAVWHKTFKLSIVKYVLFPSVSGNSAIF